MMKLDPLKDMMKTYGMKPLAEKAGVSRTSLYNLVRGENFESETLAKVSKVLGLEFGFLQKTPSAEEIYNHLAYYGAPLLIDKSKGLSMSLEEATKWALQFSKSDALLESVMPYFFIINFQKFNRAKLLALLNQVEQIQIFGYFLELANEYSANKKMMEFATSFYQKDFPTLYLGSGRPSVRALEVFRSKFNPAAKKWKVFTLSSTQEYFDRFKKWDKIV